MEVKPPTQLPEWASVAWEVVKWLLGSIGVALMAGMAWALSRWRGLVAMVRRHEELHEADAIEKGKQKAFREKVDGGPVGAEMIAKLHLIDQEHQILHDRISAQRDARSKDREEIAIIKNDIKWICREMGRKEEDE